MSSESLVIYSFPGNNRVQISLIAAAYAGVKIETPEFDFSKTKSKEFLAMNPLGKVPVLETEKGPIFESRAILRYIARMSPMSGLYGNSFYEQGLVDQWIDFSTTELEANFPAWLYPVHGWIAYNAEAEAKAKLMVAAALTSLNTHLEAHTFLVGERITAADISVVGALLRPVSVIIDAEFRKPFPNVWRWFSTCVNQEQFKSVLGNVVMVDIPYKA